MEAKSKAEFVPPKPKELDKAALTFICFDFVNGMNSPVNMGSGFLRLSVKGAIPCNKNNIAAVNLEQRIPLIPIVVKLQKDRTVLEIRL